MLQGRNMGFTIIICYIIKFEILIRKSQEFNAFSDVDENWLQR